MTTCLPSGVTELSAVRRARQKAALRIVPGEESQPPAATCIFCRDTGRWMQGMVSDPDEHTGLRSVQWPNPPVGIQCSHPGTDPDSAA